MAALSKLTDETLRKCLDQGMSQAAIAIACGVTPAAISKRVKALEVQAKAKSRPAVESAYVSMWDTRQAADENYRRCLELLDECENATEKTRLLAEIRQHVQFGMQVMETLYAVQETQAFMDEVMHVLDEFEPGTREKVLGRLTEKRALRAAFLQS